MPGGDAATVANGHGPANGPSGSGPPQPDGPGVVLRPLRVMGQPDKVRHRDGQGRGDFHPDLDRADGLAAGHREREGGLSIRDEGDRQAKAPVGHRDRARNRGHIRLDQRISADQVMTHRGPDLDHLIDPIDALRGDGPRNEPGPPGKGGHGKVAELSTNDRERIGDLLCPYGDRAALADAVLPRESQRRIVSGQGQRV